MQKFSKTNLVWIIACQMSGDEMPKQWQIITGYRALVRSILSRKRLGLPVYEHMVEYREAKKIIFPNSH